MAAIDVFDQQDRHEVDLEHMGRFAVSALNAALSVPAPEAGAGPLGDLERIEVTIVTDEAISSVHEEFMNISGATDVITFEHGEIVVSADTAAAQGAEHGSACEREIALYIAHGLLHLRGYDDQAPADAALMKSLQEKILAENWRESE